MLAAVALNILPNISSGSLDFKTIKEASIWSLMQSKFSGIESGHWIDRKSSSLILEEHRYLFKKIVFKSCAFSALVSAVSEPDCQVRMEVDAPLIKPFASFSELFGLILKKLLGFSEHRGAFIELALILNSVEV